MAGPEAARGDLEIGGGPRSLKIRAYIAIVNDILDELVCGDTSPGGTK